MKCKKCENELIEGVKFCAECGTKVEVAEAAPEVTKEKVEATPAGELTREHLMEMVAGLASAVKDSKAGREELLKRVEDMTKAQVHLHRKGEFNVEKPVIHVEGGSKIDTFEKAMFDGAKSYVKGGTVYSEDFVAEMQSRADDIYIMSKVLKCDPRSLKTYQAFRHDTAEFAKALYSTGSATGDEWVPTGFSSELIKKVRLQGKVANLHRRINMPNNPYIFPMTAADAYIYKVAESTASSGTKPTESTPGTANLTFTATKLGGRVYFTSELEEDSIVSIMPFVKDSLSIAMADALEFNIVNGDTAGTVDDTDQAGGSMAATSAMRAWDGYRKIATGIGSMSVDANDLFATSGSTANGEYVLRNLRAKLGKYGINTNELAWVTGAAGYMKFLQLPNIQTVDKYGPKAIVHSGEMAKYQGIPIIVTTGIREDLNSSGVSGGATSVNIDTTIVLVNTNQFILADRRKYTVESERDIETDMQKVVAMARHDFQSVRGTADNTVGNIINL